MNTLIAIVSDKNLNTLQTIDHFGINRVILLITPEAKKKNWANGIMQALNNYSHITIDQTDLISDSEDSINSYYPKIKDILKFEFNLGNLVVLGIGTGLRQHSLLFWRAFLAHLNQNIIFAAPDQKNFLMEQWEIVNGEILYQKKEIKNCIPFETILNLNGYKIFNPFSQIIKKGKIYKPNYFKIISFLKNEQSIGRNYELKFYESFYHLIQKLNLIEHLEAVFFGVKLIRTNEIELYDCEYDVLIFDKKQRISIFELKSGKNISKKDFEAQMALADKWGGRFIKFFAVRRSNVSISKNRLEKINISTIIFDETPSNKISNDYSLNNVLKKYFDPGEQKST